MYIGVYMRRGTAYALATSNTLKGAMIKLRTYAYQYNFKPAEDSLTIFNDQGKIVEVWGKTIRPGHA